MQNTNKTAGLYSEQEVADLLGISIEHLHELLDNNVFNDGTPRPPQLTFTNSELILLGFWQRGEPNPKVLRMPRRN
jgi:hypothetical protein